MNNALEDEFDIVEQDIVTVPTPYSTDDWRICTGPDKTIGAYKIVHVIDIFMTQPEESIVPAWSFEKVGSDRTQLTKLSLAMEGVDKSMHLSFVHNFVLFYLSNIYEPDGSQLLPIQRIDFEQPRKSVCPALNLYVHKDDNAEHFSELVRYLFYKCLLRSTHGIVDNLLLFRPCRLLCGAELTVLSEPIIFAELMLNKLRDPQYRRKTFRLDFHSTIVDHQKVNGYHVAKASSIKFNSNFCLAKLFQLLYEIFGNMHLESMLNLDLKEIRLQPMADDSSYILSVVLYNVGGSDGQFQIAHVQEVLYLILQSVGLSSYVFTGTMRDLNADITSKAFSRTNYPLKSYEKTVQTKMNVTVTRPVEPVKQPASPAIEYPKRKPKPQQRSRAAKPQKRPSNHVEWSPARSAAVEEVKEEKEETPEDKAETEPVKMKAKETRWASFVETLVKSEPESEPEPTPESEPEPVITNSTPSLTITTTKTKKVKASKKRRDALRLEGKGKRKYTAEEKDDKKLEESTEKTVAAEITNDVQSIRTSAPVVMTNDKKAENVEPATEVPSLSASAPVEIIHEEEVVESGPPMEPTTRAEAPVQSATTTTSVTPPTILDYFQPPPSQKMATSTPVNVWHQQSRPCSVILGPPVSKMPTEPGNGTTTSTNTTITNNTTSTTTTGIQSTSNMKLSLSTAKAPEFTPRSFAPRPAIKVTAPIPAPRLVITGAGESITVGHDIGPMAAFGSTNLWPVDNCHWTQQQALHAVIGGLEEKLPKERLFSFSYPVDNEKASFAFHSLARWICAAPDGYIFNRTVAVSLVGANFRILGEPKTAIVFTLRFPDDRDYDLYNKMMQTLTGDANIQGKSDLRLICPLTIGSLINWGSKAVSCQKWQLVRRLPNYHANATASPQFMLHAVVDSLHTAGILLKHLDFALPTSGLYLLRSQPFSGRSDADSRFNMSIDMPSEKDAADLLVYLLDTVAEDQSVASVEQRKYPFLAFANTIGISHGLSSCSIDIALDADIPEAMLRICQNFALFLSFGAKQMAPKLAYLRLPVKTIPHFRRGKSNRPVSRKDFMEGFREYNRSMEPPLGKVRSMLVRFLEPEMADRYEYDGKWLLAQIHLEGINTLEDQLCLERAVNHLFDFGRVCPFGPSPHALWVRKVVGDRGNYVVGLAFDYPFEVTEDPGLDLAEKIHFAMDTIMKQSGITGRLVDFFSRIDPIITDAEFDTAIDECIEHYKELASGEGEHEKEMTSEEAEESEHVQPQTPMLMKAPIIVPSKEFRPVVAPMCLTTQPAFVRDGMMWNIRYAVDDDVSVEDMRIRIPKSSLQSPTSYMVAVAQRLQPEYWTKGYGLLVQRLFNSPADREQVKKEEQLVHIKVIVKTWERPGDLLHILVRLWAESCHLQLPVGIIAITPLQSGQPATIGISALPTLSMRQIAALKRAVASDNVQWKQEW